MRHSIIPSREGKEKRMGGGDYYWQLETKKNKEKKFDLTISTGRKGKGTWLSACPNSENVCNEERRRDQSEFRFSQPSADKLFWYWLQITLHSLSLSADCWHLTWEKRMRIITRATICSFIWKCCVIATNRLWTLFFILLISNPPNYAQLFVYDNS